MQAGSAATSDLTNVKQIDAAQPIDIDQAGRSMTTPGLPDL